jgi:deoxyribodipyrimidine photo-lyase
VIPALIVDPKRLARLAKNPRRAAYYCGAVRSLARDLESRGAKLVVRRGETAAAAVRLAREARVDCVTWSAGYDARAKSHSEALQSALEEAGFRVTIAHDSPAVAPEETAAARSSDGGRGYRSCSAVLSVWMAQAREPYASSVRFSGFDLPSDALPSAAECAAAHIAEDAPSERQALASLERFLGGAILSYRSARNVPGGDPTSHSSAALSFGLISARTILRAVEELARDPFLLTEEKSALTAFVHSIARRDFFLQLAWFFEDEPDQVLQPRMRAFPFAPKHPALSAWAQGRTGYPLVDAGMRELATTGWMHPRVRFIAASFLCFDLGVDWRIGRDLWNGDLIEDDAALATGNWQWVAGVGADLAQFPRIYNPRKQARAFDRTGAYVRRWVGELANASDAELFGTGARATSGQLQLPLFERSGYPEPVLDHERVARAFLERYVAFVRDAPTR